LDPRRQAEGRGGARLRGRANPDYRHVLPVLLGWLGAGAIHRSGKANRPVGIRRLGHGAGVGVSVLGRRGETMQRVFSRLHSDFRRASRDWSRAPRQQGQSSAWTITSSAFYPSRSPYFYCSQLPGVFTYILVPGCWTLGVTGTGH
jgi:hypothetical protein